MTLLELCEPLFQAVCRLNRTGRKGLSADYHEVRAQMAALFADIKSRALATPGLAEQFQKIEHALYFFVDSMISESSLSFARDWNSNRLAEELSPPQLGGDERFFDLLDEALADRSPGAGERLGVFYTCLGLGFTGFYAGQPEYLRRKANEIAARIKGLGESELATRISPDAYEHVNTADLVEPPGVKLVGWAIALAGLIVIVLIANFTLFRSAKSELDRSLTSISSGPAADEGGEEGSR
jgi:type IV/VI secretion system ImpK/VasF family protein